MARAVGEVEEEGPGDGGLEQGEADGAQGGGGRGQGGGLEVPARQRGDEVGQREAVQGDAEGLPRDARPDGGAEPRLLVVVGGQVRGYGSLAALRGQEGLRVGFGELLGGGASVGWC